jgi:hypothetical protein
VKNCAGGKAIMRWWKTQKKAFAATMAFITKATELTYTHGCLYIYGHPNVMVTHSQPFQLGNALYKFEIKIRFRSPGIKRSGSWEQYLNSLYVNDDLPSKTALDHCATPSPGKFISFIDHQWIVDFIKGQCLFQYLMY